MHGEIGERGGGGWGWGKKQEWMFSLKSSVPATLNEWVISASVATNIYLKLLRVREDQLERGQR